MDPVIVDSHEPRDVVLGVPELGGPAALHPGARVRLLALAVVARARSPRAAGATTPKPLIAASKTAVVRGEMIPDVHLFGEPVVAQVDVILNREKVDPADVRLKTNFEPYEPVGETREERRDIGDFTVIRYTTTLELPQRALHPADRRRRDDGEPASRAAAVPPGPAARREGQVRVPAGAARAGRRSPKDKTLGRVVWAPLRSLSRINWYDSSVVGQGFPFVATVAPLPEPEYRISPTLLGLAMLALALALLALPVWLVWGRRRRVRHAEDRARARAQPARARAAARRVGQPPSVRRRAARGARGARVRARCTSRTETRPTARASRAGRRRRRSRRR